MLIRVLNGLLSGLKTLFYIAFGVAVVLFFGGFVLHLWQGAGWYKPSVKNTDYIFEVENYRFLIPRNYMWSYSKIRDGFVYEPNLHSLYPNFEPMNESNEKIFKSIGHGGGRKVVFHFKSQKNSKTVDQIIKEGLSNYTLSEKNHSDNLEIYGSDTKGYEFIIIRSGSLVQYFNCTKYDYVPYPSCSTRFNFSPEPQTPREPQRSRACRHVRMCNSRFHRSIRVDSRPLKVKGPRRARRQEHVLSSQDRNSSSEDD
jgi:hypothetical protein